MKRNNGAGWHVCKVGSDVWMEYFAVPHTLAADHIIPCYWGHIAQEWCDAFGRLFLTLKQTNVCILTVETYIQGSTWLQVNILSIQVATQQAAVLVALRPSFCLFVFLLVGGVVVYVSITRWVLLSKASTCTCLVWGKHRNLSYYFSILNLTHAACVWTVILCNDNVWICMDSYGCHQPVLIGSPPTSSTCTRLCLPAALSTWAANVASLRTVGTLHGFASGKLGIYPGHPIMFPIVEKVNSNICRMYPLNQFNIFDRSERNIGI